MSTSVSAINGLRSETWFDSRQRKYFVLGYRTQIGSGDHPTSHQTGTGEISPVFKQTGSKADNLSPSSVEIRNQLI
jgi:hypothetical protein